ncbi:hypothetical protein CPB85DRAFT_1286831 [Mucidula mucida]|nr:hypothetical protein CPB85DRAFT_1286831 [Mucidula mucida]
MSSEKSHRSRRSSLTNASIIAFSDSEWEDEYDPAQREPSEAGTTASRPRKPRVASPNGVRKRKVIAGNTSPRKTRPATRQREEAARRPHTRLEPFLPSIAIEQPAAASPPANMIPRPPKSSAPARKVEPANFFWYIYDIVIIAGRLLQIPLSLFLVMYILAHLLVWMGSALLPVVQTVCIIPGSSILMPSLCTSVMVTPQVADFPALVDVQSKTFEKMLEESIGGSTLSLEIKKSEIATKDLITLVKVSELKTRDLVAQTLSDFVNDAKATSEGLQKLSSHVKYTVDGIVGVNNHALASIDAARNDPSAISAPWYAPWRAPSVDSISMDYLSDGTERLILEGTLQMKNLADLEGRLDLIAELVSREDLTISSERDDVLSSLWTFLGGNKATLRRFSSGLSVLRAVTEYRKAALVHVVTAMHTLQEMKADIEVIRERVGAPGLVGSSIPPEVHMQSIQAGLLRLKESSLQAKEREKTALNNLVSA